jgi:hypothetical protein
MTLQMVMDVYTLMEHRFGFHQLQHLENQCIGQMLVMVVGRITDATGIPSPF